MDKDIARSLLWANELTWIELSDHDADSVIDYMMAEGYFDGLSRREVFNTLETGGYDWEPGELESTLQSAKAGKN